MPSDGIFLQAMRDQGGPKAPLTWLPVSVIPILGSIKPSTRKTPEMNGDRFTGGIRNLATRSPHSPLFSGNRKREVRHGLRQSA